jgi:hypothetical protein
MVDPWEGVGILQSYKISCAVEIKRGSYTVYLTCKITPEDAKKLAEAGWKQKGDTWALDLK